MTDRRLPRSRRTFAAITLLVMSTTLVVVAVLSGTLVPVAAIVAAVVGVLIHSLQAAEVAEVRLQWARDRAMVAKIARRDAVMRSRDLITFTRSVERRMRDADQRISALLDELDSAEQRTRAVAS
jgi:hypothetical protein